MLTISPVLWIVTGLAFCAALVAWLFPHVASTTAPVAASPAGPRADAPK